MSQVEQVALGDLPPARDFVLSAGFAGVAAVVAAIIVLAAVLYQVRQAGKRFLAQRDDGERHHEEIRSDARRAEAVAQCWDRWWQVLQTAALEPSASEGATLGLGPEVTLVLVRGLLHDAEQLGDDTLAKAVAVYQEQLLLVLAQQSGPLSKLASAPPAASAPGAARAVKAAPSAATNGGPTKSAPSGKHESPPPDGTANAASPEPRLRPKSTPATGATLEPASVESSSATTEETSRRRR